SGYLPEAVVNFLALLGWNPGDDVEMMDVEELIKKFDLTHCSKAGARFDYKKMIWFNHEYIIKKSDEEVAEMFAPVVESHGVSVDAATLTKIVSLMKGRVNFVHELWEASNFYFIAPESYDEKTVKKRWKADSAVKMTELAALLESLDDFSIENQEKEVKAWIESKEYSLGEIMNAFRLALVGEGKGPQMFDISGIIGKEETLARLKKAVEVLG
ncbi:MAG: glutamate--tRNA ligase, partial [Bacteroidaceae bacterium]|nr:glutamate--tRNA ligase [Bacteroidaceae bacterium]